MKLKSMSGLEALSSGSGSAGLCQNNLFDRECTVL